MSRRTSRFRCLAALQTVSAVFAGASWPVLAQDAEWVPFVVVAPAVAHGDPARDDIVGIVELLIVRLTESMRCAVSDAASLKLATDAAEGESTLVGRSLHFGQTSVDLFVECSAVRRAEGLTVMARLRPADGSPLQGAVAFVPEGEELLGCIEPLASELLQHIEAHRISVRAKADTRRDRQQQFLHVFAQGVPRGAFALRFAENFDRDMAFKAGTADVAVTKILVEAGQAVVSVETSSAPEAAGKSYLDGEARCRILGRSAGMVVARATCSLRLQPADPDLPAVEAVASSSAAAAGSVEAGRAALDAAGEACALQLLDDYLRVLMAANSAKMDGGDVP